MTALRPVLRWWTVFAFLASAAMLAAAHGFEHFADLPPCPLCLKQREVYWAALAIAGPSAAWALAVRRRGTPRLAAFLLFAVFAAGAVVAGFHAGGELDWWALPATCTGATGSVSLQDLQAFLGGESQRAPSCGEVPWSFAGLSMAGWNALISAGLSLASLAASMRPRDARAPSP